MNNTVLAKGMVIAFRGMGIEIDDWVDNSDGSCTIFISVPKESSDIGPDGLSLAGKRLADRIFTKMREIGANNLNIKFRIRDEVWTKEKRLAAEDLAKRTM